MAFSHGRSSSVLIPSMTRGTGVLLDASERLGEIPAGQQLLPQRIRVGGVSGGVIRRRIVAALWPGVLGLHLRNLPARTPSGVGCGQRNDHEHETSWRSASRSALPSDNDPRWYYGLC